MTSLSGRSRAPYVYGVIALLYPFGQYVCTRLQVRCSKCAFPDRGDAPAKLEKRRVIAGISLYIVCELLDPKIGASGRYRCILTARMSVPETTMYEDSRFPTRQNYVRPCGEASIMQSKPKAAVMEGLPERYLGHCVSAADTGHHS